MFFKLVLLLTVIPIAELYLILKVHNQISAIFGNGFGFLISMGIVILTGIIGARLAKQQGLTVIRKLQETTSNPGLLTDTLADGFMVLIGGLLLLTPGYITDLLGFTFLIAKMRDVYRKPLTHWFLKQISQGNLYVNFGSQSMRNSNAWKQTSQKSSIRDPDIIDIEAEDIK